GAGETDRAQEAKRLWIGRVEEVLLRAVVARGLGGGGVAVGAAARREDRLLRAASVARLGAGRELPDVEAEDELARAAGELARRERLLARLLLARKARERRAAIAWLAPDAEGDALRRRAAALLGVR